MEEDDKRYWVGVNMHSRITLARFYRLLNSFPSMKAVWTADRETISGLEGFEEAGPEFCRWRDREVLEREWRRIKDRGLKVITLDDDDYPQQLRTIEYPPPVLYLKGEYVEEDQLAVAVVGTRKCSQYGEYMSRKLADQLVESGITVVSGMAVGIDTASHEAALKANGRTVAVLGTGLAKVYPESNAKLMNQIAKSGAVFSEFPLDQGPQKWTFPQRNRIISGLTRGTIVVEAPEKSGALITARASLEQGREVFAVPGDARKKSYRGNHALIKRGAKLVEDVGDVLEEFKDLQAALPFGQEEDQDEPDLTSSQEKVYRAIGQEPVHFNQILGKTGFPTARLSHIIFQLEMKDLIKKVEGNRWVELP